MLIQQKWVRLADIPVLVMVFIQRHGLKPDPFDLVFSLAKREFLTVYRGPIGTNRGRTDAYVAIRR